MKLKFFSLITVISSITTLMMADVSTAQPNFLFDKIKDIRDRVEDREASRDRFEDTRDIREDRFDNREDIRDHFEDTRDTRENRFDDREDIRDRFNSSKRVAFA
jgi:hypothetical protein